MRGGAATSAVVIGGGVIGLACALRLCRQGLRTTLIEPCQSPVGASYGNAGHIAVEQVEPLASWATIRSALRRSFAFGGALDVRDVRAVASWLARFVRAAAPSRFRNGCAALRSLLALALPTWRELVVELQRPDLLLANGHVVLWESGRTAQRRRDAWMKADIGTASVRDLTAVELDAFGASLRQRPVAGIRFDGTGQVADAAELLRALRQAFETAGGDCLQARARALEVEGDAAVAILGGGARVRADVMLVAAGVASSELMATLGLRAPLIAERGYHVQWPQHEWPVGTPPVVFEDRALIVTRMRAGLRAASFVELARPHTAPDPRKWAVLDAHAAGLGLPVIGDGRRWFGARPTLPDYLPAIGRCAGISNLLYAFGHQHLGLTLAPITAQIVAELAAGREPRLPIAAFDLGRFQSGGATRATRRSKRMAGVEDPGALDSPRS